MKTSGLRLLPGTRRVQKLLVLAAMLICLAAAVMASVALAQGAPEQEVTEVAILTPKLIEEANDSPTVQMGRPEVDSQAADALPHTELSRTEALKLLTSVFGEAVETPAGLYDEIPPGRFVGADAEVVSPNRPSRLPKRTTPGPRSMNPVGPR